MANMPDMQVIHSVFLNLCSLKSYHAHMAAKFCGNIVKLSLHAGNTTLDTADLFHTINNCLVVDDVRGNNLRKLKELCPQLIAILKEPLPFYLFFIKIAEDFE